MRVLFVVPTAYLLSHTSLTFVRQVLGEEVGIVWEVTKPPPDDVRETEGTEGKETWVLVEGSRGLKTTQEMVALIGRMRELPDPPSYLKVISNTNASTLDILQFDETIGSPNELYFYDHSTSKNYLEWLYEEEPSFEAKLEELLDRGIDPISPKGLSELEVTLEDLKVGIVDLTDLDRDLREYVEATVQQGEFPIRNAKGEEPAWVDAYRA
jgi:hypothetical protein